MKIAAYCRVSTLKEDQLNSLEMQESFFKEYAARTNNTLVEVYTDEGISGTRTQTRKAFLRMIRDARRGLFDAIVAKDISRFARNTLDALKTVRELKDLGVKVLFLNSDFESLGESELILTIMAALAQEESANTSKRIKFSKKFNAEKGKIPNIVYGYDKIPDDIFNLSINQAEAAIINEIYNWYIFDGYGAAKIAQMLNKRGLKTKRNCNWSQAAVNRILKNPLYIGIIQNGKEEVANFLTGRREKKPQEEWFITENEDLRIVSDELFEKAQTIRISRSLAFKNNNERHSNKYLFSTLIKCKDCGRSFRRSQRTYKNTYTYWLCSTRNSDGVDACANTSKVSEEFLINRINEYFKELLTTRPTITNQIKQGFLSQHKALDDNIDSEKELKSRKTKLSKKRDKFLDMYADDLISRDELNNKVSDINSELKFIETELGRLSQNISKVDQLEEIINSTLKSIEDINDISTLTNAQLKSIIDRIEVDNEGNIDIYLRLLDELGLDNNVLVNNDRT